VKWGPARSGPRRRTLALLTVLVPACSDPDGTEVYRRVREVLSSERPFELRLDDSSTHVPCVTRTAEPDRRVEPLQCASLRPDRNRSAELARLSAAARGALVATRSPEALHASAVLDLAFQPDATTLDRVIARLGEVRERSGNGAVVLNHLAVAHAARSDAGDDPFDLFVALDWAIRATLADPASQSAAFNRALLLDRLHLVVSAQAAWAEVQAGSRTGWDVEVAGYQDALASEWKPQDWADSLQAALEPGTPLLQLDRLAAESPQHARETVLHATLVAWADACVAGDTAGARRALDRSRALARAATRANNDSTAWLAVIAIDRANTAAAARIAHGVAAWGRGRMLFDEAHFEDALPDLRIAARTLDALPGLPALANVLAAVAGVYTGRNGGATGARDRLRALVATIARATHPSLWARAKWGLAFAQGRSGDLAGADETANDAAAAYAAIRENENLGGILFLGGEVSNLMGDDLTGRRELFRALHALRPFATSSFRHNLLLHYGLHLARAGYPHASLALHGEDARIAEHTGRSRDAVEALTWLGRSQVAAGLSDAGSASLAAARAAVVTVEPASTRERLAIELAQGEAELWLKDGQPSRAVPLLTQAIDYFGERNNTALVVPVLARRAAAHLLDNDTIQAEADLALAIASFEASAAHAGGASRQLFESTAPVYDAIVDIEASRDRVLAALGWLERSRPGAHRPQGVQWSDTAAIAARARSLPAGRVVLAWAMLPERTLLWSIARDSITMHVIDQPADALVAMVDRFQNLLRAVDDTAEAALFARELYATLLAPATAALEGRNELVLVPDRALDRIPFPALRGDDGQWLIERFVLRHAPHLATALEPAHDTAAAFRSPLLVADPAYRSSDFPGLPALRAASAEVAAIGQLFPNATLLAGAQATRSRLREQLGSHDLLHFAGHARFRNDRPELSYLVLAPEPDGSTLRASDVAGLDLSGLRLVILSACATHAATDARNAGFAGLSHAFLNAGARGVVGSLWEADDEATAELMEHLHRAMAAGRSPAAALQSAQNSMIQSRSSRLRAPATWATFRFEGW